MGGWRVREIGVFDRGMREEGSYIAVFRIRPNHNINRQLRRPLGILKPRIHNLQHRLDIPIIIHKRADRPTLRLG